MENYQGLFFGEHMNSSFTENESSGPQGTPSRTDVRVRFKTHRVRPTMQTFVGLDWERCIIKKWLSLNFRIGYEVQYFWSQLINAIEDVEETDLSFEGLTFTGRIDF